MARPSRRRRAFTLLELLLALSLTMLVVAAVGMAVEFHLRAIDTGRAGVEEAQLARALLQRMADDLRSTIRYSPTDTSGISTNPFGSIASGGTPNSSTNAAPSRNSAGGGTPESSTAGSNSGTQSSDNTDSTSPTRTPRTTPGLYGTATELQIDVSRLPRLDQYNTDVVLTADGQQQSDRVSDVKTVVWFLAGVSSGLGSSALGNQGGLLRREMDRAVAQFGVSQGGMLDSDVDCRPIAPEVVDLRYEYCDGSQWYDEWDCEQLGGLPVAVRITLFISSDGVRPSNNSGEGIHSYSLLVQMPAAEPTGTTETTDTISQPTTP